LKEAKFAGLQKLKLHIVYFFVGAVLLSGLKKSPDTCSQLCMYQKQSNSLKESKHSQKLLFLFLGWAEKLITYMCPAVYVLKTKHFLERGHFVGPDLR
jgi:hypothetical protein